MRAGQSYERANGMMITSTISVVLFSTMVKNIYIHVIFEKTN